MGLTIEQLIAAKTKEEFRDELLLAMRGIGYVVKGGPGEGAIKLSGLASAAAAITLKITEEGSVGVAWFQYSVDGGDSYNGVDIQTPSLGQWVLPGSGVTVTFINGPGDAQQSFLAGDVYVFSLQVPTLPTTSWLPGSTALTIVETDAAANEDFAAAVQGIAKAGFLSTATDHWLDLHVGEIYGLSRDKGQVAIHSVRLVDAGGGGPHSIAPGQLTVAAATGERFSNTTGGTLLQWGGRGEVGDPGPLDLPFQAERPGASYNLPIGAINNLLTTLPGVQVSNIDLGAGISLLQQGVNREVDAELRKRAKLRWGALGVGATQEAYELWAQDASGDVVHVRVKAHPSIAGGVMVVVAGPAGPVTTDVLDDVQGALEPKVVFGSVLEVVSATAESVDIVATVYIAAGQTSGALAAMTSNLTALFQGGTNSVGELLPGFEISNGTLKVYRAQVLEQMQLPVGVRNVDIATLLPATDVDVAEDALPIIGSITITPVEV